MITITLELVDTSGWPQAVRDELDARVRYAMHLDVLRELERSEGKGTATISVKVLDYEERHALVYNDECLVPTNGSGYGLTSELYWAIVLCDMNDGSGAGAAIARDWKGDYYFYM